MLSKEEDFTGQIVKESKFKAVSERMFKAGSGKIDWKAESGLATAEYAVVTVSAVAFAGVLLAIVKSDAVKNALTELFLKALG